MLNARERVGELEKSLFRQVCAQVAGYADPIGKLAAAIASVDVFSALAEVAVRYRYVRPVINQGDAITIKNGRHPVVERPPERWQLRTQRRQPCQRRCTGIGLDRAQHGRQVHLHPPGGHHRPAGPDWQLRAGRRSNYRAGGPHFYAGRPSGRPDHRPVHFYGGNGGNGGHPQPGHAPLAGHPGRNRPGHQHLRRPVHCPLGHRAPAQ